MRFIVTQKIKHAYNDLPADLQRKADKALKLMQENPKHPSLRLKKIKGTHGIWEVRVDRCCQLTLEILSNAILLRNIGKHDETLDNP